MMSISGPSTLANNPWLKLAYLNRGMILVFWGILPVAGTGTLKG